MLELNLEQDLTAIHCLEVERANLTARRSLTLTTIHCLENYEKKFVLTACQCQENYEIF